VLRLGRGGAQFRGAGAAVRLAVRAPPPEAAFVRAHPELDITEMFGTAAQVRPGFRCAGTPPPPPPTHPIPRARHCTQRVTTCAGINMGAALVHVRQLQMVSWQRVDTMLSLTSLG
jgi:hypothetical protein